MTNRTFAKPVRIPSIWRELFAGDSFASKLPYHRLVAISETLAGEGYAYRIDPTPTGYMVNCLASPLVTLADGYSLLTGSDAA